MIQYDLIASPVGELLVTGEDGFVTGLYFEEHKYGPAIGSTWKREPEAFDRLREELGKYFKGALTEFSVPLRASGTAFQESVWKLLREIPHGATRTYGDLARELGMPNGSRAVGSAVGRNPISIVVPCHRVLGSTGAITGFAGGLDRKSKLLELEGKVVPTLFHDAPFLSPKC